jgi:pimeloyl-ACP methyl ester carboxylesterase
MSDQAEMELELVSIATDSEHLDGLFYTPREQPAQGAILLMHGNCQNFYSGAPRFLPPVLTRLGYACLAFNRRGHDIMVAPHSRDAGGGAFQTVREAIADNRYAAQWLAARGFPAPIVIGHSHGGMLAVRHCADHPETPALILLSAHGGGRSLVPIASSRGLLAGDRLDEITTHAENLAAAGREQDLILLPGWWYVTTARTFLDHLTELPDVLALAPQIRCPSLFLRGDSEPPVPIRLRILPHAPRDPARSGSFPTAIIIIRVARLSSANGSRRGWSRPSATRK